MTHRFSKIWMAVFCLVLALCMTPGKGVAESIDLVGFLENPAPALNTDVWGWVDPATLIEYALVGNNQTGVQILDVSDPASPVVVATAPVPGFDVKTFGNYMYSVDGNYFLTGEDGRITDISDPKNPVVVGSIRAGHNLFVDHLGYLYVTYPGLQIFDLNPDPENPTLVWTRVSLQGHDVTVIGDRLYDFHGNDGTFIYDVTNRSAPVLLGSITDPTITFHHSGWTSADESYLLVNDEMSVHPDPDIIVFDISTPSAPVRVAEIADPDATAHNSYRIGDCLYVAYYTAGLRVYDISDPRFPVLADEYDTTPLAREGLFKGAWGCYPFSPSGWVFVSDRPTGFFVFASDRITNAIAAPRPSPVVLHRSFPNPFHSSTTMSYELPAEETLALEIYSVTGARVRTLFQGRRPAGEHEATWDGRDDRGRRVPSGVYFGRITAGHFRSTVKMVLAD